MNNNEMLYLPLKKEWYRLIESGEKKEEYRELSEHWVKRVSRRLFDSMFYFNSFPDSIIELFNKGHMGISSKYVQFSYGYTKRVMIYEIAEIKIGRGKKEWGAPPYRVFVIKLGKRIK